MNDARITEPADGPGEIASTSKRSRRRAAPAVGETRQVNVKLSARKMQMVDRLAARRGVTLVQYFDDLITQDIRRQQDELREYYRQEEERARQAREALDHDLKATLA